MKVLMITPRVDESHDLLGFIPTWIRKLAEKVDKLYIVAMDSNKGTTLPENVYLYSLDEKSNRPSKLLYFNRLMIELISKVDVVFCHMYPNFTIMAAPYAKLFRKPIVTWYAHGHVSRRLRIAHLLANKIVTSSAGGFRLKTNKVVITGQGIDTEKFKPIVNPTRKRNKQTILTVGRISPVKDYETLIKAVNILINEKDMKNLEFIIIGSVPLASQEEYYKELNMMIKELKLKDYIKFVGTVPHDKVADYYQNCDVFVNTSHTGSLDKAVLEAMACEKPVITCNEAYLDVFDEKMKGKCFFRKRNHKELVSKIEYFLNNDDKELREELRKIVVENHSVESFTGNLVKVFMDCCNV